VDSEAFLIIGLLVAGRLLLPLAIPRYPLPGILACLMLDSADQTIMQAFGIELAGYQGYDKALDVYYLSIAYLATMRNWENVAAFQVGRVLFYFRLLGVLAFELTGLRLLLAIFPNAFEPFFIYYELVRRKGDPLSLTRGALIGIVAVLWLVVKLPHEWWIHVARFDGTDFVKTKILGARSETLFWRAIVEAPVVTGAITVAVALLALAIWRLEAFRRRVLALVRRLGHWGRGARDAARESESLGAESPGRLQVVTVRGQAAATLRPRVLLEKIVLVTIVSVVFQQTLPGLLTSGIRTAISIAAVVIATDFLLRWELRRFGVPFSARRELASTGALNFLVVTLLQLFVAALRPGDRPASALVFGCVIALFVTLYDHYRPVYEIRRAEADAAATQAEEIPGEA
jgi:hypothetical protein